MPQPLGSLVSFSKYGGDRFDHENAHLVIDVGYFTTDWVLANGFTMDDRRSGGAPGGASQIYQRIAQLISNDEGDQVDDIERIDKCLREKKPLLFYGTDIALSPYVEQSQAVISSTVKEMQNKVGRTADLRSIVLTGGGAALYEPVIRAAFPRVPMDVLDAPCFANVKGFLIAGEATLLRERKQGAAACVTDSLVMKVAISEIATPTLYQVMVNIKEPRERAGMLKRVAEHTSAEDRSHRSLQRISCCR